MSERASPYPLKIRDISRKVTKAFRTRHENGAHYGAYAPLGYCKDPEQTGHLLVDDETKWIVEKIFSLAIQGAGAAKDADGKRTQEIEIFYRFVGKID